jgi:hypothetical protein
VDVPPKLVQTKSEAMDVPPKLAPKKSGVMEVRPKPVRTKSRAMDLNVFIQRCIETDRKLGLQDVSA